MKKLFPGQTDSFTKYIDFTLGTNTEFVLDYEQAGIQITITSPTGQVFNEQSAEVTNDSGIASSRLIFMDTLEVSSSLVMS